MKQAHDLSLRVHPFNMHKGCHTMIFKKQISIRINVYCISDTIIHFPSLYTSPDVTEGQCREKESQVQTKERMRKCDMEDVNAIKV